MIIIELTKSQQKEFKLITKSLESHIKTIESQKLGGDEIIFQSIITLVTIASPYIVNFFQSQKSKNQNIIFIKNGIRYIFENEDDLKKFLDTNTSESSKND